MVGSVWKIHALRGSFESASCVDQSSWERYFGPCWIRALWVGASGFLRYRCSRINE